MRPYIISSLSSFLASSMFGFILAVDMLLSKNTGSAKARRLLTLFVASYLLLGVVLILMVVSGQ